MDGLVRRSWWAMAALMACAPAQATPVASAPALQADTTRLTVTGSAEVQVPADRVRLRFAVETEAASADAAAAQNGEIMGRVLQAVRSAVGPDDRVETAGYRLMPRYRPAPERDEAPEIAGYRAQNGVLVVLVDPESVGGVLDAALEAGANRVTDLSFFASDVEEARLEAVREATARARREAEAVAAALGLELGPPLEIQSSGGGRTSAPAYMRVEAMADVNTPVETGSETVAATVTITWRLDGGMSR
jgi:uncharacterized protein YggE